MLLEGGPISYGSRGRLTSVKQGTMVNASSMRALRPRIALAPCGGQAGEVFTDIRLEYLRLECLLKTGWLPKLCSEG